MWVMGNFAFKRLIVEPGAAGKSLRLTRQENGRFGGGTRHRAADANRAGR